jgi:hypothetical protein
MAKLSRNAPCPCGSGKKYKYCCIDKGFQWNVNEQGRISKSVPLNDEMTGILEKQRRKFVEKYEREPGEGDKVFFDMPDPEEIMREAVEAMQDAGIDPALIYAYKKTGGLMVIERNKSLLSERDLAEWDAAIDEYYAGH